MTNLFNKRGSLLIMTYYVISSLVVIGAAFVVLTVNDQRTSNRHQINIQAVNLAESGLEQALYQLKLDYNNSHSFQDGDINGISAGPDSNNYIELIPATNLGIGSYQVDIKNVGGSNREIWVKASGIVRDNTQSIEAYVKMVDGSVWSNAIFVGNGSGTKGINGNADIRGSVHILGTSLTATDKAISLSGGGFIGNNYLGLTGTYLNKIAVLPTTTFNGESVASLFAQVRVKSGVIDLTSSASLGLSDSAGNAYKETLDNVLINDGLTGTNASDVFADNDTKPYDLSGVSFPSLTDSYPGYVSFQNYLYSNALVISDSGELATLASLTDTTTFSKTSAKGSITFDGAGNLSVSGIVYLDGGGLNLVSGTFNYTGSGVILVSGNITINANLLPATNASFPSTNIITLMTPQQIIFNQNGIEAVGLFYGENQITFSQQASIAGSLVSNYIDMPSSNPTIIHVPAITSHLPSGTIASTQNWMPTIVSWKKL